MNFLNYNISNFNVEERGSLREMIKNQLNISKPVDDNGELE